MVGKNQTSSIYGGITEHPRRGRSICLMGLGNRAFPSAFWSSRARRDSYLGSEYGRSNVVDGTIRYGKGVAMESAKFSAA